MPNWLRWILAVPAAVVAYVASQVLVGLMSEGLALPATFRDWSSQAANSVVGPWALVAAGAAVAPRARAFHMSVVLAVAFGVLTGVAGALAFLVDKPAHPRWWLLLSGLLGMATVIVTCVQIQRRGAEERVSQGYSRMIKLRSVWILTASRADVGGGRGPTYLTGGPPSCQNWPTEAGARRAFEEFAHSLPEPLKPDGETSAGRSWISKNGRLAYHLREFRYPRE